MSERLNPLIYSTRGRRSLIDRSNGSEWVTLSENSVGVQGWLAAGSHRTKPRSACMMVHEVAHQPTTARFAAYKPQGDAADPASFQHAASAACTTTAAALPQLHGFTGDDEANYLHDKLFEVRPDKYHVQPHIVSQCSGQSSKTTFLGVTVILGPAAAKVLTVQNRATAVFLGHFAQVPVSTCHLFNWQTRYRSCGNALRRLRPTSMRAIPVTALSRVSRLLNVGVFKISLLNMVAAPILDLASHAALYLCNSVVVSLEPRGRAKYYVDFYCVDCPRKIPL